MRRQCVPVPTFSTPAQSAQKIGTGNEAMDVAGYIPSCGHSMDVLFQVYSVNFHPYYRATGEKVVNSQEYYTNYSSITYPDDIYTRGNLEIGKVREK